MYANIFRKIFYSDDSGLRKSELVEWYLGEMEAEMESEDDVIQRKTLAEKVIYRLIHHVSLSQTQHSKISVFRILLNFLWCSGLLCSNYPFSAFSLFIVGHNIL